MSADSRYISNFATLCVQRNGRSVLEFVRCEDDLAKAEERVKGMNLERVQAPIDISDDEEGGADGAQREVGPLAVIPYMGAEGHNVSASGRQAAENPTFREADEVAQTPVECTPATTTSTLPVSAAGRHPEEHSSPAPCDADTGYPVTPGKNLSMTETESDSLHSVADPHLRHQGQVEVCPPPLDQMAGHGINAASSMHVDLSAPPSDDKITLDFSPVALSALAKETLAGKQKVVDSPHVGRQPIFSSPGSNDAHSDPPAEETSVQSASKKRLFEEGLPTEDFPENAAELDAPTEALSPVHSGETSPKRQRATGGLSQSTE